MFNNDDNMPRGQISVTELNDNERQPWDISARFPNLTKVKRPNFWRERPLQKANV